MHANALRLASEASARTASQNPHSCPKRSAPPWTQIAPPLHGGHLTINPGVVFLQAQTVCCLFRLHGVTLHDQVVPLARTFFISYAYFV